jgi:hypothetical protein
MLNKRLDFKKNIIFLLVFLTIASCFWDETPTIKKVTEGYYLKWVYENGDQFLLRSSDEGKSGIIEIPETVFAVGFNDKYIIAKQHPNLEREISERLFGTTGDNGDFLLKNPSDTVFLSKDDRIYQENGKWYHISNGWNPPDSLKPYKRQTLYHIIDITKKKENKWTFKSEADFLDGREKLGIPTSLDFSIVDKELE